jgi:hypothetical protein
MFVSFPTIILAFACLYCSKRKKKSKKPRVTRATRFVSLPFEVQNHLDGEQSKCKHGGIGLCAHDQKQQRERPKRKRKNCFALLPNSRLTALQSKRYNPKQHHSDHRAKASNLDVRLYALEQQKRNALNAPIRSVGKKGQKDHGTLYNAAVLLFLHMALDGFKGNVADIVLNLAGILCGNLFVYAKPNEKLSKNKMALIYLLAYLAAYVGEGNISILINGDKAAVLEKSDRAADAGLGEAHLVRNVY